ncbi:hypothetical protein N182_32890 [Sinorhizobium sp. GL2]|nr:hypothetical protein N182_32890 [Sinorhizobium sp. GL2]
MKKLIFVDHAAHKFTKSSNFFLDILRTRFDVHVFYIEPERLYPENLIETARSFDLVVVWQMDYLASVFTIIGLPTVVIPMFDGSELMPDLHWILGRKASYLNFSLALHHRVRLTGGTSRSLRYFRPPVDRSARADLSGPLNVFLWMRRPDHGVTLKLVETLMGGNCARIHVHHAPDRPEDFGPQYLSPSRDDYDLTVSQWGEDPAAYHRALAECNVFIAPRLTEGIGMAFLEAMARGMVVLANDRPTHTEYISNWLNGILFSANAPWLADLGAEEMLSIAEMAYLSVVEGHRNWVESIPGTLDFIENTPAPNAIKDFDTDRYARALFTAYYSGLDFYRYFLTSSAPSVLTGQGITIQGTIDDNANVRPAVSTRVRDEVFPPLLRNARMDPLSLEAHVRDGRFGVTEEAIWIKGKNLTLHLSFGVQNPLYRRGNLSVRLPRDMKSQKLVVSCNEHLAGIFELTAGRAEITVDLPTSLTDVALSIRLQATEMAREPGIESLVSLGVERVEFE